MSFYFAFPQASAAFRRCPPERLLIAARTRTPSLMNAPMCTVAFTAVNYERLHCKLRLELVRVWFQTRLSGKALTSMPYLLRVGICFCVALLSLYVAATEINQMGPL